MCLDCKSSDINPLSNYAAIARNLDQLWLVKTRVGYGV